MTILIQYLRSVVVDRFIVRVFDGDGGIATDDMTITINGLNDDPEMARTLT